MMLDAASWRSLTTRQRLGHLVMLFLKRTPPYAVAGSILGVTVGVAVGGALGRISHRGGSAKTGGIAGGAVGLVFGVLAGLSEALLGMLKIATDDGSRQQRAQQQS